jgi:hypothetical protein
MKIVGIKYLDLSPFLQMASGKDDSSEAANENHSAIVYYFMYSIFVPALYDSGSCHLSFCFIRIMSLKSTLREAIKRHIKRVIFVQMVIYDPFAWALESKNP